MRSASKVFPSFSLSILGASIEFLCFQGTYTTLVTDFTRSLESEQGERYRERYWRDEFHDTVEQIQPIAEKEGITMAQLAVGWVLAKPFVTSPIVGATNPTQLDDAIAAVANPLSEQIVAELDEITKKYRTGDDER